MAKILLANELGDGLGHVKRLEPLARAFAERGHEPAFALNDLVTAAPVLGAGGYPLYQAPVVRRPVRKPGRKFSGARSFADILAVHWYADPEALLVMVEAWQRIVEAAGADLVIADHSPTLCLATLGATPTVVVGNGFTVPPAEISRFPVFNANMQELASHEDLLRSIATVQKARGRPALDTLPGIYGAATRLVCTLPELDPYARYRSEPAIGPTTGLVAPAPLPETPRLFAYLHADQAGVKPFLGALAQSGVKGAFYLSGAPTEITKRLRGAGFDVYDAPPPLADMVPAASVIIHHGGPGTAAAALSCGRPQIVMPRHFEQTLYGRGLVRQGLALAVSQRTAKNGGATLRQILGDKGFAERAQAVARRVGERDYDNVLAVIVECCLAALK